MKLVQDELSLKIGDVVSVSESEGAWWLGTCNGRYGCFPSPPVGGGVAIVLL